MGTICSHSTYSGAGVEWEHRGQPLETLLGRELEAALQLRKHQAPVQRGDRSWCPEPAAWLLSQQLGHIHSPQMNSVHLKREKGKENLCSFGSPKLLELLSSCAPGETKDSSVSKRISELEYRNWGFKSSLAFDGETREKWGIEADKFSIENYCLRTEVEQLKTLLAAMEHRDKLMEKLAPVSATLWLCKSVHCTYPEPWDRGIWYNNGDDETTENADSKCEPRKTERPKIPTSITVKMFSTNSNDRTSP